MQPASPCAKTVEREISMTSTAPTIQLPLRFPAGFHWGAATAAHQIEGNNINSDWWMREHTSGSGIAEPSGDACDSFHRYREDMALLAAAGLSTYRFSLEWSRIEP